MGAMLPRTQITNVRPGERPSQEPTGTPPRSSIAGVMEMRARTAQSGRPDFLKKSATCALRARAQTNEPRAAGRLALQAFTTAQD